MLSKNAIPVPNGAMRNIIESTKVKDVDCNDQYIETFSNWITASKNNQLLNLDLYKNRKFCHGTIQAFDHFYIRYNTRRFRFFKGDFVYHRVVAKNRLSWEWLDDATLDSNDAVIISVPFSDIGDTHPKLKSILDQAELKKIPVLLDCAYYGITKGINLDLGYSCIDTLTFSISKAFDSAQYLRCGIRFQRENFDDGIDIQTDALMLPRASMQKAIALMENFEADYNWNIHGLKYYQVCQQYNLQPTNTVIFGLGNDKYFDYNRGGNVNRVCIANALI
jgi:hypothetical protein